MENQEGDTVMEEIFFRHCHQSGMGCFQYSGFIRVAGHFAVGDAAGPHHLPAACNVSRLADSLDKRYKL
jgi:hypothetical protein